MNKKTIVFVIFAFFVITANAQFLFRIDGNGLKEPSYMLGTIHILPSSVVLDSIPEYVEVEAKCRQLYAEQDMKGIEQVSNMAKPDMFLPEGKTIGDILTSEQFDMLKTKVKDLLNKNLSPRTNLKPINFINVFYTTLERESMNKYFNGNIGFTRIDLDCINRASKRDIAVGHLDSYARIDSLPDILGLSMEMDAQIDSLVSFLSNFEEIKQKSFDAWKVMADMMDYWIKGDFNGFSTMDGLNVFMALNPADLLGRNKKWIPIMTAAMSDAPTMFVFGALHLTGKEGIIQKLREEGYKVEQINIGQKH